MQEDYKTILATCLRFRDTAINNISLLNPNIQAYLFEPLSQGWNAKVIAPDSVRLLSHSTSSAPIRRLTPQSETAIIDAVHKKAPSGQATQRVLHWLMAGGLLQP